MKVQGRNSQGKIRQGKNRKKGKRKEQTWKGKGRNR